MWRRAEGWLVGARATIFPGSVLVHGAVLEVQLSRGSATAACAAGLVGPL